MLYRDEDAFRHQAYVFDDWSRGHYGTETLVGTRPGGAIAAAWAVMNFLGESGYLEKTKRVLATRRAIEQGVRELGLEVWGKPELSILSFGARHFDIFAVGDRLMQRGWYVSRLAEPPGIHLMLNLTHEPIVTEYLADLRIAVEEVSGADLSATDRAVSY